jgi:hypothetical protein
VIFFWCHWGLELSLMLAKQVLIPFNYIYIL